MLLKFKINKLTQNSLKNKKYIQKQKKYSTSKQQSGNINQIHLSNTFFADLPISSNSKKALTKFDRLTTVQASTLPKILEGYDVLAKAKTGTGKTIGFLLPSIESVLKSLNEDPVDRKRISMLVLSPTRELASQIYQESVMLTSHHPNIALGVLTGGTSKGKDNKVIGGDIDILIATPGKLMQHLRDTIGFDKRFRDMKILVLDEADRLLDMGFQKDLKDIIGYLNKKRQTLLFSATIPESLKTIQTWILKKDHLYINTVMEDDNDTNLHVIQESVVCDLKDQINVLNHLITQHIKSDINYKIIVFFTTARMCGFMSQLFKTQGYPNVIEMHSRKNQPYRDKASTLFKTKSNQIMFSSDVSARGMDYTGISLVLQIGLTDKEQYIHRLGRTGRAGAKGKGIIVLSTFEKFFLQKLSDLSVTKIDINLDHVVKLDVSLVEEDEELKVSAAQAYRAFLGFYISNMKALGLNKKEIVKIANKYSKFIGLESVPAITRKAEKMMGLSGVFGLTVEDAPKKAGKEGNRRRL